MLQREILLDSAVSDLKQPLHAKLRQHLRELILQSFEHGQRFYSERDLRKKFKLSQPTVRRALDDLVREGYLTISARRGFFICKEATTRCIGVFVPEQWPHTTARYRLDAVSSASRASNCTIQFYYVHPQDSAEALVASVRHNPIEERILFLGQFLPMLFKLHDQLEKAGYRTVAIGSGKEGGYLGSYVATDHAAEVNLALDHLVNLGHRHITFLINEPETLVTINARLKNIQEAIAARGLSEVRIVECGTKEWSNSFESAYDKMSSIFSQPQKPTALVPISGVGAWAAMRYFSRNGIKVPEDVSVLSFDDLVNSNLLPIPLTSISVDDYDMAKRAIALLWDTNDLKHGTELIQPNLTVRESTSHPQHR